MARRRTLPVVLAVLVALLLAAAVAPARAGDPPWWEQTSPLPTDSEVNATGEPARSDPTALSGLVDAHTHLMSDVGFGGALVCGSVFDEHGADRALVDCDSHRPDGRGALVENLTRVGGGDPFARHDPAGWPTFADWPSATSLTHQQTYYRWVERAWRGGQRVLVADAVNNSVLCALPLQRNRYACDDMSTVRRQIERTRSLEAFVDARHGGPGRGWLRIVRTPAELRRVVAQGRLAVVLGVEVSAPFGCSVTLGVPRCTTRQIDAGLDELDRLGVRSMFLCHKFDNALCGVRFDSGAQGTVVNAGNFLQTGSFWQVRTCTGPLHDNPVGGGPLPAAAARATAVPAVPLYPPAPHCNPRGLTALGEHALRGMIRRGMMVEIDHMSVKAATRALDVLEQERYPGVLSSHSWMAPELTERVYRLGGFVAQYGHGSRAFLQEADRDRELRRRYGVGYAFGMDMNGFGGTPRPRSDAAATPLRYPFTGADGAASLQRQRTGQRVWDYNRDGVAHYGLVPDWVEDLQVVGGPRGREVVRELLHGPESYARTWERAAAGAR